MGFDLRRELEAARGVGRLKDEQALENFLKHRFDQWYRPPNLSIPDGSVSPAKLAGIAWGEDEITGTGVITASTTVLHGLGVEPRAVFATSQESHKVIAAAGADATGFSVTMQDIENNVWALTYGFFWLAIA